MKRHPMRDSDLESVLPLVQKPARYTGGETNVVYKESGDAAFSFALAFPDVYEVGMSHTGLQILYGILNSLPDWRAERVYAPWPDMEGLLRGRNIPLSSLESGIPLNRFDVVGFSLQYELSTTNVLCMLELGRIPLRGSDRRQEHPVVIVGGPCTFNPEPTVPFFDAFVIGEGEEVIVEIAGAVAEAKRSGKTRTAILERLAELDGLYVPSVHGMNHPVKKRTVADIDNAFFPENPVVPLIRTIHDRITLEIARGCTRGCRFCQAGMVWRPYRERNPRQIVEKADRILEATGYDELSLLALSAGDYSCIGPLMTELMNRNAEHHVALALPSLRTETLTSPIIEQIKRVRKTSFTLAPEAGTQRLRDAINKGNREEDLLDTARIVFEAGWKSIKLYFMIGLPGERREDLEGITDLVYKVLRAGGNRRQVTASLSTFIPKPHTPFQWERQISPDETEERQRYFKDILRHRNLKLKWHDRRMSFLEGVIARGDRRVADVIERVYRLGARFDGWSDLFHFELWKQAFRETGFDQYPYLENRTVEADLPWSYVDAGVDKNFLLRERKKAATSMTTEDCRTAGCYGCGACRDGLELRSAPAATIAGNSVAEAEKPPRKEPWTPLRLRLQYRKAGKARFLSHLDTASALIRAIARSGLRFDYSRGFHPNPKISFPCATPLGIESESEFADIWIRPPGKERVRRLVDVVNRHLPAGLEIISMNDTEAEHRALSKQVIGFVYEMQLDRSDSNERKAGYERRVKSFLNAESFIIERTRRGTTQTRDLRPLVESLVYDDERCILRGVFLFTAQGGVKPQEILTEVMGMEDEEARTVRVVKKQTLMTGG
ncbi:MAG TPA: TIGR03960 family B12-binding radical SAM protein [Deltaproteobacteria bacterium]|nr:TIGR03960 family B12-binding radical SAM protein [Deltaproteobacteria bacterium]